MPDLKPIDSVSRMEAALQYHKAIVIVAEEIWQRWRDDLKHQALERLRKEPAISWLR